MKDKIFKFLLMIWIMLWIIFLFRELFFKENLKDYLSLFSRSLDGKYAYIMGDDIYKFLQICKNEVPEKARYKLLGSVEGSIEKRRIVYHLYPRFESDRPDFVIDITAKKIEKVN